MKNPRFQLISDYQGCSDYRVTGLEGCVSVRYLKEQKQAWYNPNYDPQLLGSVVNGLHPVSDDVLNVFQASMEQDVRALPELGLSWVPRLVTAKWYPTLGWIRCEP